MDLMQMFARSRSFCVDPFWTDICSVFWCANKYIRNVHICLVLASISKGAVKEIANTKNTSKIELYVQRRHHRENLIERGATGDKKANIGQNPAYKTSVFVDLQNEKPKATIKSSPVGSMVCGMLWDSARKISAKHDCFS